MGIGLAMTEARILDQNHTGKMVNRNWHDYKLPTALDVPEDIVPFPSNPMIRRPTPRAQRVWASRSRFPPRPPLPMPFTTPRACASPKHPSIRFSSAGALQIAERRDRPWYPVFPTSAQDHSMKPSATFRWTAPEPTPAEPTCSDACATVFLASPPSSASPGSRNSGASRQHRQEGFGSGP